MAIDFESDLDIFFDDFADALAVMGTAQVLVIFAAAAKQIAGYDMQFQSSDPFCLMKSADVAANELDNGSVITIIATDYEVTNIDATDYEVTNIAPDGAGLSVVTLINA